MARWPMTPPAFKVLELAGASLRGGEVDRNGILGGVVPIPVFTGILITPGDKRRFLFFKLVAPKTESEK